MLIQEKISGSDTLLKLYVAIDEDLKALPPQLQSNLLPRDPRGGTPTWSAAEVVTMIVGGPGVASRTKPKFTFISRRIIARSSQLWERTANLWTPRIARVSSCGRS
jgi:hypothetical protein